MARRGGDWNGGNRKGREWNGEAGHGLNLFLAWNGWHRSGREGLGMA